MLLPFMEYVGESAVWAYRRQWMAPLAVPPGLEGSGTAADEGRGAVPPPDTYTVRPGDTLWDLSGRFLNNPWYWPKIWSYNPDVANPHWIYPGNTLKFFPSGEEGAVEVVPVEDEPVAICRLKRVAADNKAEEDAKAATKKKSK